MGPDRALHGPGLAAGPTTTVVAASSPDDSYAPPWRLYSRLRQFSGYIWDESKPPIHTPNDIWLIHGIRFVSVYSAPDATYNGGTPSGGMLPRLPNRSTPFPIPTPDNVASPPPFLNDMRSNELTMSPPAVANNITESIREEPIVARVTYNVFREERNFQIAKTLSSSSDSKVDYIVRPLDFLRLNPVAGDRGAIIVTIYEDPGDNDIMHAMDLGPAFYMTRKQGDQFIPIFNEKPNLGLPVSLTYFLDFAIGAARCLEMLHHQHEVVHGEIRGDSFHYNVKENKVKISVFGSGIKFFEHGLYGSTWTYYLSHGLGARNRLLYISPEQTGRMAVEPDTRTDIYSLGIVFWTMLTRQPAFEGENVIEIVQSILRHRIPDVSQIRMDVPQAISDIIQKCTAKTVNDRYHSASGLRFDLQAVQQYLVNGDLEGLQGWEAGTRDASSLFTLSSTMIGRDKERNILQGVVERVAATLAVNPNIAALSRSDTINGGESSPSSTFATDSFTDAAGDISSENGSSSLGGLNRVNSSDSKRVSATAPTNGIEAMSVSNFSESSSRLRPWERNQAINTDTMSIAESIGTSTSIGEGGRPPSTDISSTALSRPRTSIKSRRRGQCEVVTIEGPAGMGKSMLVQSVLTDMRKRGYCATGKFDNARRTAFGPLLKLLSSLFKQVWGERNTETPFHQELRNCVEPIWPQLHTALGLPVWLLSTGIDGVASRASPSPSRASSRQGSPPALGLTVPALASAHASRGSSPITPMTPSPTSAPMKAFTNDMDGSKGSPSSNKSICMISVVLEVLRLFARHKFLCVCLDDLHFADDESLDLITQIIGAKIRMAIIMTYRPDEISAERVHSLIHPFNCDGCTRPGPIVTNIRLNPLCEDDVIQYVALTLHRTRHEVAPLAVVIHSKSGGNPFYMREMLTACHRKRCVLYGYREGRWAYDVDKVYADFSGNTAYDVLDTGFVTQRLKELPSTTRAILTWASLLGNSFSFQLICHLLSGEFLYDEDEDESRTTEPLTETPTETLRETLTETLTETSAETPAETPVATPAKTLTDETAKDSDSNRTMTLDLVDEADVYRVYTQADAISGLNTAIQASVLVPSEVDDRFRFAHDRYVQAAMAMKPCSLQKMHFVIAQTLLKYQRQDDQRIRELIASHVCEAAHIIRKRVPHRRVYRQLLSDCAQAAVESGARPTAAKFYNTAVSLLQDDAWNDQTEDCSYNETLSLHVKAANCSLYLGHHASVASSVTQILEHGRTPIDRAPAHVLNSRMLSQIGDTGAALTSLKQCVDALGVNLDANPTFKKCNAEFLVLEEKFKKMDVNIIIKAPPADPATFHQVGVVLAEALIAAWWTDSVVFYNLALATVNMYFTCGYFPQAGMAFVFLGMLAISYLEKTELGVQLGEIGTELFRRNDQEDQLINRGWMIYFKFISHLTDPLPLSALHLEEIVLSDRTDGNFVAELIAAGLAAMAKLALGENCYRLEIWCVTAYEDMPGWESDTRGGSLLISVRQAARALQGKTSTSNPHQLFSDEDHNMEAYKTWISEITNNGGRSLVVYEMIELSILVLYGHFHEALAVGKRCIDNIDLLWSARSNRQSLLYYSWALTSVTLEKVHDETGKYQPAEVKDSIKAAITEIEEAIRKVEVLTVISDVNYKHWLCYMRGFIKELQSLFGDAVRLYEVGVEHSAEYSFLLEEAVGQLLLCNLLSRRQAPWLAGRCLQECLGLFRNFGAFGVVEYLEQHHQDLLQRHARRPRAVDKGVQTDSFAAESHVNAKYADAETGDNHLHTHHYPTHDRAHSNYRNPIMTQTMTATMAETIENKMICLDEQWQSKSLDREGGTGLPELDIIDLQAILRSSQVISSVLRVEDLLRTMCDVILQTCGSATLVGIVTKDHPTESWVLTASGSPENGATAHLPGVSLDLASHIAENVIHYCTRFRESVFVQDMKNEDRFGNISQSWIDLNPGGKAIIAIPIQHVNNPMLGVLYLEGNPYSFTDRNMMVLGLLVNQICISYSNALAMKALEKASAETSSAAAVQKKALDLARAAEQKARESETKARHAEEEAKKNVQLAEEAARVKSSFLANVSHELRTPLNGVIGNADLLSRGNLDAEQQEIAESIRVSADLLLVVINDLLDFSRIEAQKMQLHKQPFMPHVLVSEAIRATRFTHKEKLSVNIIEAIGIPPDLSVVGDPIRLHQVLGNLINNSAKFTNEGTITIGARIEKDTPTACVLGFWVEDTGIGIEKDVLPRLFQPFSQADNSTSRVHGGSGLGLSICKSLVQSVMGGTIDLESTPGKGTKVWFQIEFEKADPPQIPGDPSSAGHMPPALQRAESDDLLSPTEAGFTPVTPTTPGIVLSRIPTADVRVCVAEDNMINQRIAVQFLRRLGYVHIDTYDNGRKAVDGLRRMAAAKTPYHLVLMDVQMPVMDGYQATKVIRQEPVREVRDVLIIAMTASAIHGDREKCLEAGMNDYLAKPVKSEVLKKKIEAYIRATEAQMQAALPIRSVAAVIKGAATPAGGAGVVEGAIVPAAPSRGGAT